MKEYPSPGVRGFSFLGIAGVLLLAAGCCSAARHAAVQLPQMLPVAAGGLLMAAAGVGMFLRCRKLFSAYRTACSEQQALAETVQAQRLQQEQLQQQFVLEKQTALSSYHSAIVHGMRMPISVIQGYAELLLGGLVSEPGVQQEYLEKIRLRCLSMNEFLNRQQSGLATTALSPEFDRVDLLDLCHLAVSDVRTLAADHSISLQVLSTEPELIVEGDRILLNRVFYNILENAIKYMGRPGTMTFRLRKIKNDAELVVQDDGLGMDAEDVLHVFEQGYQGSNHIAGQGGGLYLVRQIIDIHHGEIRALSRPGVGMKFIITLPCSQPEEPPQGLA